MRKRLAGIWLLSPRGGTLGLVAGGQGPSHHCQPGWERLLSAASPHIQREGIGWLGPRRASVEPKGTGTHRLFTGPSSKPLNHALTPLVAVACKKHRNGTMDCLFRFCYKFILLESFGQMSLQPKLCDSTGSFSQAEPPKNP